MPRVVTGIRFRKYLNQHWGLDASHALMALTVWLFTYTSALGGYHLVSGWGLASVTLFSVGVALVAGRLAKVSTLGCIMIGVSLVTSLLAVPSGSPLLSVLVAMIYPTIKEIDDVARSHSQRPTLDNAADYASYAFPCWTCAALFASGTLAALATIIGLGGLYLGLVWKKLSRG